MKVNRLIFCVVFINTFYIKAQTGIGTTTPSPSAKLEVASSNQGFLPPRIALTASNAASPVSSPATGLLVYNNATAGTSPNNVTPGYYYWNGSAWVRLIGPTDNSNNVTGIVPVVNGGTGVTTATGSGSTVLSNNPTLELLTISSGASQFPSSIFVNPTTYASSKRAALWLGDWGLLQDYDGNGQRNFSITQNSSGTYPTRFFIGTDGKIGIGNASPVTTLTVGNASGTIAGDLTLNPSTTQYEGGQLTIKKSLVGSTADWIIDQYGTTASDARLRFFNSSETNGFVIKENGFIGMGNSSPTVRLQVSGDIIANSIAGSSDARFKTNVFPIENPLQKVLQLRGVTFDWKTKSFPERLFPEKRSLGFIAQEVEQVIPEVVQTENNAEGYKSVQYDKVVALLVEAIKEQQKQIIELQQQVQALSKKQNQKK